MLHFSFCVISILISFASAQCSLNADCASCVGVSPCKWCATGSCIDPAGQIPTACTYPSWIASTPSECGAPTCSSYTTCATCTTDSRCGWCQTNSGPSPSFCTDGTSSGPTIDTCSPISVAWNYGTCNTAPFQCSSYNNNCAACVADPRCGWCNIPLLGGTGSAYCDFAVNKMPSGNCPTSPTNVWQYCSCSDSSTCDKCDNSIPGYECGSSSSSSNTRTSSSPVTPTTSTSSTVVDYSFTVPVSEGFSSSDIAGFVKAELEANNYFGTVVQGSTVEGRYKITVTFPQPQPSQSDWDNLVNGPITDDLIDRGVISDPESLISDVDLLSLSLSLSLLLQ